MPAIINAAPEHIPIIRRLAHRIWPATFEGILTEDQIAYMLEWMYSPSSLQEQMDKGHQFLLVKDNEQYLGYASYEMKEAVDTAKLHKIYILPSMQGKGTGRQLIQEISRRAKGSGKARLQLNVNRYNKAVTFYEKLGFRLIRQEDNDIGNGFFMNDHVMEMIL